MPWFLTLQQVIPASPGSSPEHWTTKAVVSGVVVGLIVCAIGYIARNSLADRMRDSLSFRVILFITEPVAAVILSVVTSFFETFKRSTYIPTPEYRPD